MEIHVDKISLLQTDDVHLQKLGNQPEAPKLWIPK